MADDHAAKAISAYGSGLNETPNIDRIASEGIRFNHCYVTNSICTPSRAAILTGTYNHVNGVTTLNTPFNNRLPNVAKHLRTGGYKTAIVGKWHLGEGKEHEPAGFDYWSILPGQGDYFDPHMIEMGVEHELRGYTTDLITEQCINWLEKTDKNKPFFLMCHHKAPHREWEPHPKNRKLFTEDVAMPSTFDDDYKNRAKAAAEAKMRIKDDITYDDLGLVQPEGGSEIGERSRLKSSKRKIRNPINISDLFLIDKDTGEKFTFNTIEEFHQFKYQRYIKRYLRTIASIDESVGSLLDYLDKNSLTENTIVIYTSDQGFFLGEHGWFDKRFMYEESLRTPILMRYPKEIKKGTEINELIQNLDFAPTFLDYAGIEIPSNIQGKSFRNIVNQTHSEWRDAIYYTYYEYPSVHMVKRHYGVRTHRYKLMHFYYDIDEWEMYDLEEDPSEMNNIYDNPEYVNIKDMMHERLVDLRNKYGDSDELNEMHLERYLASRKRGSGPKTN